MKDGDDSNHLEALGQSYLRPVLTASVTPSLSLDTSY